ncbi:MAG: MgtC/SapB family protein [Bacteroidetes bacterium]|nr:MgtC/SapB family protein [Bacteroidota bacterium]
MNWNWVLDEEFAWRILFSFLIGTAIGFEREYRSKAAGLRTMIMICLGATIFTEVSINFSPPSPAIASTIVTGIGFLGAGVIFKDGLTVTGLTTATTIWISAALGMAVGAGEYFMAMFGCIGVIVVLAVFDKFTFQIERFHQIRTYKITYDTGRVTRTELEKEITTLGLKFHKRREMKGGQNILLVYEVSGKEERLDLLNQFLYADASVKAFEY